MATTNSNSNNNKEQLLVCWLEPQTDAGKVSAIPASWIVSTVSGDGRSPDSVVRCRWPRTKRLYRARIVSSAEQQAKNLKDNEEEEEEEGNETFEKRLIKEELASNASESPAPASGTVVKEEMRPSRTSQISNSGSSTSTSMAVSTSSASNQQNVPVTSTASISQSTVSDASALVQVLLPTLKKLFNNELSKLSTDIQANFDIIGHKISALDGTVKCIKTRVDRMETLLNTAAQELGDTQPTSLSNASSQLTRSAATNNSHQSNGSGIFSTPAANRNVNPFHRNSAPSSISNRNPVANVMNATLQQRPQAGTQQSRPITQSASFPHTPNRSIPSAMVSSYPRQQPPPSMVSTTSRLPSSFGSSSAPSSLKRRRPTATTNPPLPKAVVITAPNGVDIYLGGDKNYKMPLVMYKDALKNCTRPVPTYMVMALIRRYLTPDEMSRTWLTEQQLLGKKDGMLLDQHLLSALKKQAVMQFPGSGIDDRLLVRKLYDVFHGIRRQMRKKRREAGELGFGSGKLSAYNDGRGMGMNDNDNDSGSGNDGMDDDTKQNHSYYDEHMNDFDDEDGTGDQETHHDGRLHVEGADGQDDDDLMGNSMVLNGDEDLEEMAAKHAAFWAGADDV